MSKQRNGKPTTLMWVLWLFAAVFAYCMDVRADTTAENTMNQNNHLGAEKSPYLLQHKDNPVNWYSWGNDAFQAARKQEKPIFLSIGYSTCYWCHVMEKESFESEEVAKILNEHFISIKIDREERPDVDKIYMDFVVALTGHGGWPMSVFLTPSLQPFHGGTYFPKPHFMQILEGVGHAWKNKRKDIISAGEKFSDLLAQQQLPKTTSAFSTDTFKTAYTQIHQSYDSINGGFGKAPKFPPTERLLLLMRIFKRSGEKTALSMVETTLERMARGGLYDHLGGGFSRYSTDDKWLVPHFEKMLYDNALLIVAYLEAHQLTKKPIYAAVARETLDYVLREMTSTNGGFYSAQDAGEVGEEGEYYVWTYDELARVLDEKELALAARVYGLTKGGNFEGKNILNLQNSHQWTIKDDALLTQAHKKLLAVRTKRTAPHKDDKILTAWNGLMISAMARAAAVLNDKRYLTAAQQALQLIRSKLYTASKLQRRYRDGEAKHAAVIDDYAFLIRGLLDTYEADFDTAWISWAIELQNTQDELFWDNNDSGYFYSPPGDSSLIARQKEFPDGAEPSANGIAAANLFRLHDLTYEKRYLDRAEQLLQAMAAATAYPSGFASTLNAFDYHDAGPREVIVVGNLDSATAVELKSFLKNEYLPYTVSAFGEPTSFEDPGPLVGFQGKKVLNEKTTIYVCENGSCKLPTNSVDEAKKLILEFRHYKLD